MVLPTTVSLLIMLTLQGTCLTVAAPSSPSPTTYKPINPPPFDPFTNSDSGIIIVVMPNSETPVPGFYSELSTTTPGAPTDTSSAIVPTTAAPPATSTLQPPASETQPVPFLNESVLAPAPTRPPRPAAPVNQFQPLWQNPFLFTSFAGNDNFKESFRSLWGANVLSKSLGGGILGNTFAYSTFDLPDYYWLLRSRLMGLGPPSNQFDAEQTSCCSPVKSVTSRQSRLHWRIFSPCDLSSSSAAAGIMLQMQSLDPASCLRQEFYSDHDTLGCAGSGKTTLV
ncbi:hypothetical protein C0Q70_09559 [Pomacea canaliculata]|uniref:Uncharacterized protein n=1 Tax=Pomacea canaliculata TaxID=400727 RepID=A0A2T7PA46_POMCA|nr:hypothetical protein C0Q70_09559 [Pomacea canaliculata]